MRTVRALDCFVGWRLLAMTILSVIASRESGVAIQFKMTVLM